MAPLKGLINHDSSGYPSSPIIYSHFNSLYLSSLVAIMSLLCIWLILWNPYSHFKSVMYEILMILVKAKLTFIFVFVWLLDIFYNANYGYGMHMICKIYVWWYINVFMVIFDYMFHRHDEIWGKKRTNQIFKISV